jgi:tRNA(His) 5'-end guanylyltransferase
MTTSPLEKRGIGELQRSLERFETYNDGFILPDTRLVIRLDAHRLGDWSRFGSGEYPCGPELTKAFHTTAKSLLTSSFRVIMAYAHGDEISLFIDPTENSNPLRRSKLISAFASAAALHFRDATGLSALFDARLSELPSYDRVVEYFMWQRRYCFRNALTISLRKALAATGLSPENVERRLHGLPESSRIDALAELGLSLDSIPATTRRGAMFSWQETKRGDRSEFSISEMTSLPDDDGEFVTLTRKLVTRNSRVENASPALEEKPTKPSPTQPVQPSPRASQGSFLPTKRSNVSIVRVAQNSDRSSGTTSQRAKK